MSRKKMKKSKILSVWSKVCLAVGVSMAVAGVMVGAMLASLVFPLVGVGLMFGGIVASAYLEAGSEEQSIKETEAKRTSKYLVEDFKNEKQEEKADQVVEVKTNDVALEKEQDCLEKTL